VVQSYLVGDITVLDKANEWIEQQAKPKTANLLQSKLGMSKKAFKQTVGVLYKAKEIIIEETGIRKV
jgi:predicted RNA-binding protein (virulence factor B family)